MSFLSNALKYVAVFRNLLLSIVLTVSKKTYYSVFDCYYFSVLYYDTFI